MQKKLHSNTDNSMPAHNLPKGAVWPEGGQPAQNVHHANSPIGVLSEWMDFAQETQKLILPVLWLSRRASRCLG